ncbi:MAG: hypothetical protein GW854_01555 [Erythrobacter sp.]|nr:hypothetical protein [Erythrobacter sp.]
MTTTTTTTARSAIDQTTIDLAIEAHDAFDEQVQLAAVDPIDGLELSLNAAREHCTDEQEIAAIEDQMGSIYDTVIRDEWMKAEEAAGARELRMPMEHDLRSAFSAFAHLPVHQHAEQTRRILAGIMSGTTEFIERSKIEDLIVNVGDWLPAARDGDRLDAPKTEAVKRAVSDWGVIETSREVVRHREEQEQLHAEVVEDEPCGSLAMAASARTTVEVRPRMSSMEVLTAMVREQD